jgi:hypothetical protein
VYAGSLAGWLLVFFFIQTHSANRSTTTTAMLKDKVNVLINKSEMKIKTVFIVRLRLNDINVDLMSFSKSTVSS